MSSAPALAPVEPRFRHQPPSVAMQWVMAVATQGVMEPLVHGLERVGGADWLQSMAVQAHRRAEANPFRRYAAGPHDVVVMTYPKSGTHWMLQIAHQLIHHALGGYDHRRSRQGGSSELLTRAQQRAIDAHFTAEPRELGSDFPYDEFCDLAPADSPR